MLKRERTAEEKRADAMMRRGMMLLGAQSSPEAATPNPFPYVLHWDRLGRKNQRCRVLKNGTKVHLVEFDDGFQQTIDKRAIRRL